jgi:uncharacterized protein (TIGR03083 family)
MSRRTPSSTTVAQIRQFGDRVSELAKQAPDPSVPIPATPEWTLVQVLAHLVTVAVRYSPDGEDLDRWPAAVTDVAALNDAEIAAVSQHDLPTVLAALRAAVHALPCGEAVDAGGPVPYTGGLEVTPVDLYGLMLGEFVVHGHDLAAVLHRPWRVEPEDAVDVIQAVTTILPAWVDPDRAAGVTCTISLRIRGDRSYLWQFTDGRLVIDPPDPRRVDVTISARPVAMLMLFYGRLPLWRGIITGQLRAWGRKPRLAFSCNDFFRSP